MTIESALERIAEALETIAAGDGVYAPATPPEKAPPKKAAGKPAKETIGKVAEEPDDGITKDQVRDKLQQLQKATTPAQAKSILKGHGASTIGNLPVSKYAQVIAQCEKLLAE